jgi:uncharacterized protein (TIRG00374 family)
MAAAEEEGKQRISSPRAKHGRRGRRSLWLRAILQIAAVVVATLFFFRERHLFLGFGSTMSRITWWWLVLAFAAELASIVPLAEAQRMILHAGGTDVARWPMILVTFASNGISMSVPAGVAVAEGYAYGKYRRLGARRAVAAWAELAAGAIAFAALAGLALAGALIAGGPAELPLLAILSVVFAGAIAAAILFRHPHVLVDMVGWLEHHAGRRLGDVVGRTSKRARDIARALEGVHPRLTTWVAAGALSALNWLLDVACLGLAFQAIGAPIPWGAVLLAFAGGKIVSSVGITPAGLGFVEGGLVAVFVAFGTRGPTAVGAVLVYRGLTLIGLVGMGWGAVAFLALQAHRSDRSRN